MRIGLIAMSGIRVCDQELLRLGLTLPGFVERSKTIASLPSLGLLTLAGQTPPEHKVRYIEVPALADLQPLPGAFDLVAVSSYSAQIGEAYELASRYRAQGVPVAMGGPHVTALPNEALEFCTSVIVGEGEAVWMDVLNDCALGCLKPIYDATGLSYNLADSPMPAFELLDINKYNRLTVQTSRGCPHRCEFCAGSILLTDTYKQKPIDKVVAEIDRILGVWPNPFLEFADDNSMVNKSYWRQLLDMLGDRRFRWFAETDISIAEDEELLGRMRDSGCAQVLIGLESPSECGLAGLELRSDWKRRWYPRYKDAIDCIQSHGITVNGCFVIGLDGHTKDIFGQVYEFVRDAGQYEVQITIQTPFPGTPLYDRLAKERRLLRPNAWERCTLFDVNYIPAHMSPEELAEGFRQLAVRLYSTEFTNWRRDNFKKRMRTIRHPKGQIL